MAGDKKYNIILYGSLAAIGVYIISNINKSPKVTLLPKYSPTDFIKKYYKFALESQQYTGVPFAVSLAQAAIESGWGRGLFGNNFFGIKATKDWPGQIQKLPTWEYGQTGNPVKDKIKDEIIQIIPPVPPNTLHKYRVRSTFRKYNSPADSFIDHAKFLKVNPRYKNAFKYKDPYLFLKEVAKAGYATDPDYAAKLKVIIDNIYKYLKSAV